MWLRIKDVEKEDVRVARSLKHRWDYRHFWGHVSMLLFIALKSEVLADRNFFCCSVLLASVRDLIKQLRVPADNRSLEGICKNSWRLDKVHIPVLHMKCGGCWKMVQEPREGEPGVPELPGLTEHSLVTHQWKPSKLPVPPCSLCSLLTALWECRSTEGTVLGVTLCGHYNCRSLSTGKVHYPSFQWKFYREFSHWPYDSFIVVYDFP